MVVIRVRKRGAVGVKNFILYVDIFVKEKMMKT